MSLAISDSPSCARALLQKLTACRTRCDWEQAASLAAELPAVLESCWLPAADEAAFALGQLGRHREATELLQRCYELEPTWRRASALAWHFYSASMNLRREGERCHDLRELLRKGFRTWLAEALRHRPDSIKDLYRLGVFEAQVESRHDAAALRALLRALELYDALPDAERARRGDLRKIRSKALYCAGRSALRLGRHDLARKASFCCIRVDKDIDDVDPVHKLHLAARVCLATGELDHAERAARLALDAKGPPRRDYLFGLLCDISLRRSDAAAAITWIDAHVPPHRRDASLWRRLGDALRAAGHADKAMAAWDNALRKDRGGRHLTLVRLGELCLERGEHGRAEDAFRKAADFCRTRYMRDDPRALAGLSRALEARGNREELARVQARLAKTRATEPPPLDDDALLEDIA